MHPYHQLGRPDLTATAPDIRTTRLSAHVIETVSRSFHVPAVDRRRGIGWDGYRPAANGIANSGADLFVLQQDRMTG